MQVRLELIVGPLIALIHTDSLFDFSCILVITSPTVAKAKYCDEYVCLSVHLSVCPPGYLRNHTDDLYQFFVPVAYGRGSVVLRQGDEIPRGGGNFGVFLPVDNAL